MQSDEIMFECAEEVAAIEQETENRLSKTQAAKLALYKAQGIDTNTVQYYSTKLLHAPLADRTR